MTMNEIIDTAPQNQIIQNTLMKTRMKLDYYRNPVCSVSGGSDSDTMLDIIERVRGEHPVTYVFFDTGIEYQATHRHLAYLEEKYSIKILRRDAVVKVPKGCKQFGLPFISKDAAQRIKELQKHNFRFEEKPYDVLLAEYPNCKAGVEWWCNGRGNEYGVAKYKYLKEFMTAHPPTFAISDECCKGAKKKVGDKFYSQANAGIRILGLRQSEGGRRSTSFTSCFSIDDNDMANYRPLWFWTDADKAEYKAYYGLTYSDCYEIWGFTRTGCAGCPFNSRFEDDLLIMQQYEPQMYLAAINIFGKSYDYTRQYRQYRDERKRLDKLNGQTILQGA